MTKQTVLVFGGSGFLGSYVADELSTNGYDVTIFDKNKSMYISTDQRLAIGDILDIDRVLDVMSSGFDVIFNFAGLADINVAIKKPLDTVRLNILGNTNILEGACKYKPKRFVYASSVYVFSNKSSFYGVSKQSSEKLVEAYSEQFGFDYTIIRYGSVYGDRADEQNRIYRIIKQALLDKKIIFAGDGSEEREYIHAKDAARLSVKILEEEFKNQHIILTGVERYTYSKLLEMIKEMLNEEVKIEYLKQDYKGHYTITPYSFHPTVGKKIINNPFIDFGQGLLEMMASVHKELNKEESISDWVNE